VRKSKIAGLTSAVALMMVAWPMVTSSSVSAAAPVASQAPLSAAGAAALSTDVTQRVIVVMKDQVPQFPASRTMIKSRTDVVNTIQDPIRAELSETKAHNVHSYTLINAVAATVSPGEEARLKANPAVAEVVPDQIIRLASPFDAPSTPTTTSTGRTPLAGTCPAPGAPPLLEPQALEDIGADSSNPNALTARSLGIDGSGVTVAFIADGLDINDPDFIRPDGSHVFVDYQDFSGEGTSVPTGGDEAFLDASAIAAQGEQTYDISHFSDLPLNQPCDIRIEGVAPGASLVGLDIFGAENAGFNSSFIQAINYAVTVDHVNVLNESLGNNYYPDDQASLDLIKAANDAAVAAGTTVTASSGDAGVTNTIGTPATDPNVISVGASTTYQFAAQVGYGGFQFPQLTGWLNNNISSLSSSGYEQDGSTISLVAPGELNWALCSTDVAMYSSCSDFAGEPSPVEESGGTSESSPTTAGVAALVIQAYAKTHGGSLPTPALVKQFITSTADDIQAPADEQGSGLLDAYRAVLAAEAYQVPATTTTVPDTLLESTSQFNAVAPGGTAESFTEQLTNLGSTPATVAVSSRTLGAYTPIATSTVNLSDTASPESVDYQGITDNYEAVTFNVGTGVDRLNGSIAYQGASSSLPARVRMALITPSGQLADYSLPQGVGNYGDAQVADPAPGTWTAYIWSRGTASGGTTGPVLFGASVASYEPFGTVSSPTVTIGPGATEPVTLSVTTPRTPGDTSGSLVLTSSSQPALAIPVTLRTLVPSGKTTFSGVLTGGNGRTSFTGETEYYQLDVKAGEPELNASIKLANNPNNQTYAFLVDPYGQAQAFQSNGIVTYEDGQLAYFNDLGTSLHVLDPAAGLWTLIISFSPTVSGMALSEPFTVSIDQKAAKVSAAGLPITGRINAEHPAVVDVKVTNTGIAPEAYFIDGRTDATAQYSLPSLTSSQTSVPATVTGNIPFYLVPSETTEIVGTAATTGTEPIQFDLGAPTGDPDVGSGQGLSETASVQGSPVTAGEWDLAPDVVGPFGAAAAPSETVNTTLTATTQGFDPAVSADTGDLWQAALGAPITVSPVIVAPGHSAVIPVTFAPTGAPGTKVSGELYLDDDSLFSLYGGLAPYADTIAAIPYSYVIKG
jgi:Subtilase family/Peptidase inhibitor I9